MLFLLFFFSLTPEGPGPWAPEQNICVWQVVRLFLSVLCFFFGGWSFSGNINPPGGLPETRPWFLETRISLKSAVLKSMWFISFNVFLNPVPEILSAALTF